TDLRAVQRGGLEIRRNGRRQRTGVRNVQLHSIIDPSRAQPRTQIARAADGSNRERILADDQVPGGKSVGFVGIVAAPGSNGKAARVWLARGVGIWACRAIDGYLRPAPIVGAS